MSARPMDNKATYLGRAAQKKLSTDPLRTGPPSRDIDGIGDGTACVGSPATRRSQDVSRLVQSRAGRRQGASRSSEGAGAALIHSQRAAHAPDLP